MLGVGKSNTGQKEMTKQHGTSDMVTNTLDNKIAIIGSERGKDKLCRILEILVVILTREKMGATTTRVIDTFLELGNPRANKILLCMAPVFKQIKLIRPGSIGDMEDGIQTKLLKCRRKLRQPINHCGLRILVSVKYR